MLFVLAIFSVLSARPAEAAHAYRADPSASEVILLAQAPDEAFDFSTVVITEGKGFGPFSFQNPRCNKEFIKSKLGEPAAETYNSLNYIPQYGIYFRLPRLDGPPQEVRLEKGFKGRLSSNVTLTTPMRDVFQVYGAPVAEQTGESVPDLPSADRTLYRAGSQSAIMYSDYGLVFRFEAESISQIALFSPQYLKRAALSNAPREEQLQVASLDSAPLVVREGIGFDQFLFRSGRCTKDFIRSKLGRPAHETGGFMNYTPQLGIDFWVSNSNGLLQEIRLNRGFKGRLTSNVTLATPMQDVFSVYGAPVAEQQVRSLQGRYGERILYRMGYASKIFYHRYGLLFWFRGDSINQIVIFKSEGQPPPPLRKLVLPGEPVPVSSGPEEQMAKGPPVDLTEIGKIDLPANPRWRPIIYIDRLRNYLKRSWILAFLGATMIAILLYPVPARLRRLYYRWRPLPEGRLIIVRDPSHQLEANVNIWYLARQLKKRTLLVGSSENADIRLCHESVKPIHAFIRAHRSEDGVVTYIEPLADALVAVDDRESFMMPLRMRARVKIGKFTFQYEQPSEYRQVQVRYRNGRRLEGVPTTWDIESNGFIMLPSRARSWVESKFVSFNKIKGVYFMRDWDEDVRKKLLKGGKNLFQHPAKIYFSDGETAHGYMIGDYTAYKRRFYFFPQDQSGEVVYILVERSGITGIAEEEMSAAVPASAE